MTKNKRIDKVRATQAREALNRIGITQAQLARVLGVSPKLVNEVLRGRIIGKRGAAHKIAVALGLKDGEILPSLSDDELLMCVRRAIHNEA